MWALCELLRTETSCHLSSSFRINFNSDFTSDEMQYTPIALKSISWEVERGSQAMQNQMTKCFWVENSRGSNSAIASHNWFSYGKMTFSCFLHYPKLKCILMHEFWLLFRFMRFSLSINYKLPTYNLYVPYLLSGTWNSWTVFPLLC